MLTKEYRNFGSTGLRVSPLGLGTVKIGRNQGVKYPTAFSLPADEEVIVLLNKARELGINLIDTAPAYGLSEERLGNLLSQVTPPQGGWVIVTKAGETFNEGHSRFDMSAEAITQSVERSLKRLKRDVIDCVLIHSDGRDLEHIENDHCLDTLELLKKRGLIRSSGMSSKTVRGGLAVVGKSDGVMVEYNLAETSQLPVIQAANVARKFVLIKKGLLSGHLGSHFDSQAQVTKSFRKLFPELEKFTQPGITSVIMGTLNPEHLEANAVSYLEAVSKASSKS